MLIVTDIYGNTEALTGYKGLKRYRNTSGERSLKFLLFPTQQNAHSFDLVQEESLIEFEGELFRVKQLKEKPTKGKNKVKEVVAIRKMFDLINSHQYEIHNGSMTFEAALQFVLGGTGYTWTVLDTFYSKDFENFGDDNRIALFQEIMNRYGSEFELEDKHFAFKRKIGIATDFQFRYGYNIKTIDRSVNTNNLSTYIKGYGKGITLEYISPNADKFVNEDSPDGYYHAKPIRDERYTTETGLMERLKAELQDEPELSITIDFADMRRQGFPYDVPNEGDEVFVIYEPLELDIEARIMEIEEEFVEGQEYPKRTNVTLANFKKSFTKDLVNFKQTQKQVRKIFDGSARLPYSVLDEAVKNATEALQSAQTELEFENGIIARSKDNPNHIVLLTSAGLGVSTDGGATFRTAVMGDGIVADLITVGTMLFDRLKGGQMTLGGVDNGYGRMMVLNAAGEVIADLNAETGGFSDLYVANLISPTVTAYNDKDISFVVDPINGDDLNSGVGVSNAKRTIQACIDSIPKHNDGNVLITLHYDNAREIYENVRIEGFTGKGKITLDGQIVLNYITGDIIVTGCNNEINVKLLTLKTTNGVGLEVFRSPYVYANNVRVQGQGNGRGFYAGEGGNLWLTECNVVGAALGIYARYFGNVYVRDCTGLGETYGLAAQSGGVIRGLGTAPGGKTSNTYVEADSTIQGSFTYPSAPAPEAPATETTKSWAATSGDNWSTSGYWGGDGVKQGNWGYGRRTGIWLFGSAPSTAVTGKTIKNIRVKITRSGSGGYSGKVPIYIGYHGYTSKPGSSPTVSGAYHAVSLGYGESAWVTLPAAFRTAFANGTAKGIGVYVASDSRSYYAVLNGAATLEITYA